MTTVMTSGLLRLCTKLVEYRARKCLSVDGDKSIVKIPFVIRAFNGSIPKPRYAKASNFEN
ncbi:hypothetical protein H634G_11285 [Metarhizium anisopliae BRIP 53293]|uniref:Uncharacterized protein n=1 Tax=Metarhizium anisopliae BRIP 53293 TaxID=1291518 RepID=A0A0D9NHR4_METAN|nr:hypothetical protein H634G_11285 [Metarhizium anisopliae BRIP 53293]